MPEGQPLLINRKAIECIRARIVICIYLFWFYNCKQGLRWEKANLESSHHSLT
uniref:Uncharacterized protein n=1 Tax=Meloidogyne incognita TaxID=6306 RepID=A0A914LYC8_MELIC